MSWQWIALGLMALFIFGLGYLYGFERGVKGARDMVREDCKRLGMFYIGPVVFKCYEIKLEKTDET